eukprot:Gb_21743 [translate_table: standard]
MIQLLFTLVLFEGAVALFLMVNIPPLRKLSIKSLDWVKTGKGPAMVRTLAGTLFVILASSITSILKIQNRAVKIGTITPTDQILMRTHFLEASLMAIIADHPFHFHLRSSLPTTTNPFLVDRVIAPMPTIFHYTAPLHMQLLVEALKFLLQLLMSDVCGSHVFLERMNCILSGFALFLALIIDRLHHYVRELSGLRMSMESLRKQAKSSQDEYFRLKDEKDGSDEMKLLKDEIADLRQKLQKLTLDSEAKERDAKAAEANAIALRKQSEGFLLEYDRLLEDNQNLRSQLSAFDRKLSHSDSKKNT